jgi:hypothetical protein
MSAQIPVGAKQEDSFEGTHKGDTITVILYTGHASDGYKSNFERRPARWIEWLMVDPNGKRIKRIATRYGGKRFDIGPAEFAESVAQLRAAGVKERT